MKICSIGDLHGIYNEVVDGKNKSIILPSADILIIAGDACNIGSVDDVLLFNKWLQDIQAFDIFKHIIFVAGNHDRLFEYDKNLARNFLDKRLLYLEDELVEIDGIKFYGTPWQLPFNNWAFNIPEDKLADKFARIPEGIDILITHSPPYGIMDSTPRNFKLGSKSLLDRVYKVRPKFHCFGHIHHGYGAYKDKDYDIQFYNVSLLNEAYALANKPIIFEI